jgi:hypothetical protein
VCVEEWRWKRRRRRDSDRDVSPPTWPLTLRMCLCKYGLHFVLFKFSLIFFNGRRGGLMAMNVGLQTKGCAQSLNIVRKSRRKNV